MERVNKNEVVGDKVRFFALQLIEDENYDLENEFTPQEIAGAVTEIALALVAPGVNKDLVVVPTPVDVRTLNLQWRAKSGKESYISCSDNHATGVGRSVIPIFSDPFHITEDEVRYIIEMMNEAWYLMNNA